MKTIALAISDPTDGAADGVAAAKRFLRPGDRVVLFHSLHNPALEPSAQHTDPDMVTEARDLLLDSRTRALQNLGQALEALPGHCRVEWTANGWQALIQFANEMDADLIIARSERTTSWRPFAKANSDWQLIRHSNVPLLLTRKGRPAGYRTVLAAVDPLHLDDKPAELDHRILAHADQIARRHDAALCVLNVVTPSVPPISVAGATTTLPVSTASTERVHAHRARLDQLVDDTQCAADDVCVLAGAPADEIVRHCEDHDADLVVMGAVSRSALRNALIGNTAEKVLSKLNADTLIIKPGKAPRPAS